MLLNISPTIKIWVLVVLTAGVAGLQMLLKMDPSYAWIPGIVQVLLLAEGFFTVPTAASKQIADLTAKLAKPIGMLVLLGLCASTTSACLSSAPVVPVTPDNQAKVTSCQGTATFHDGVVVGDFVVAGTGATLGTVAALEPASNASLRDTLAVGAAIAAGVGAVGAGLAELTAVNFTNSKCSDVVGPLPMKPAPSALGWPVDWPHPVVSATESIDSAHAVVGAVAQ